MEEQNQKLQDNIRTAVTAAGNFAEKLDAREGRLCMCLLSGDADLGMLGISADPDGKMTLEAAVCRNINDRPLKNSLPEAGETREEISAWLRNVEVCGPVIGKIWTALAEKVDEYCSLT